MNYGQDFAEYTKAFEGTGIPTVTEIGILLFVGFLLVAAFMDWETREVYNLIWGVSVVVWSTCFFAEWYQGTIQEIKWGDMMVFILLQQFFFCRFYGRADCHAFSCCAMFLSLQGKGIYYYLLHMVLALGILAIVQLLVKNVNRRGDLKEPVAFVPYIAAAFVFVLLF